LPEVASFPGNQWCALIGGLTLAPVPGEPPNQSENVLQMGTRMCGNVGAVEKENTSLHVLNVPLTQGVHTMVITPICAILRAATGVTIWSLGHTGFCFAVTNHHRQNSKIM